MSTAVAADDPACRMAYPIVFSNPDETSRSVTLFTALQYLLPVYQLAGWLPKQMPRPEAVEQPDDDDDDAELTEARALLQHFEPFFTVESKVIPNGALLYSVERFRLPTPRGPRALSRAFVETPRLYFCPLAAEKGGGHFLSRYENPRRLRRFTYAELDRLRFAWVAVRELLDEHRALQRSDGAPTGLARRDIRRNNAERKNNAESGNGEGDGERCGGNGGDAAAQPLVVRRPHPSSNVLTGPSAEARKGRAELREKKYMRDLLRDECAARWPHTPPHKSVIITVAEEQAEVTGGRKGRKGPRAYLATVELPMLNKKGGVARFVGPQWCATKQDAENAAAEVALRSLRSAKA